MTYKYTPIPSPGIVHSHLCFYKFRRQDLSKNCDQFYWLTVQKRSNTQMLKIIASKIRRDICCVIINIPNFYLFPSILPIMLDWFWKLKQMRKPVSTITWLYFHPDNEIGTDSSFVVVSANCCIMKWKKAQVNLTVIEYKFKTTRSLPIYHLEIRVMVEIMQLVIFAIMFFWLLLFHFQIF